MPRNLYWKRLKSALRGAVLPEHDRALIVSSTVITLLTASAPVYVSPMAAGRPRPLPPPLPSHPPPAEAAQEAGSWKQVALCARVCMYIKVLLLLLLLL